MEKFSPHRSLQGPGSDRNRAQTRPHDTEAVPEQHGEAAPCWGPWVRAPLPGLGPMGACSPSPRPTGCPGPTNSSQAAPRDRSSDTRARPVSSRELVQPVGVGWQGTCGSPSQPRVRPELSALCDDSDAPQPSLPRVCAVTVATPDGLNLRSLKVHRVKVVSFSCTSHTSSATALGWWLRGAEWSITTESSIGRHGSGPRAQNRAFGKRPWALV